VLQQRLQRSLEGRQLTAKRAAWVIAASTFLLTLAGGVAAWLIDRKDFDGLGDALWWAVQTVTTVGYGDVVPEHVTGRLIGIALMLQGIALLTVITAAVTATLVEQTRRRLRRGEPDAVLAKLEQVEARLESIEEGMKGLRGER
jgi:voltage-gated potassium channel